MALEIINQLSEQYDWIYSVTVNKQQQSGQHALAATTVFPDLLTQQYSKPTHIHQESTASDVVSMQPLQLPTQQIHTHRQPLKRKQRQR